MAASAWTLYNKAKGKIGDNSINLGSNIFKIQLHDSDSNAETATLSTAASVNSQLATGNGYTSGGKTTSSDSWGVGRSASEYKLDGNDVSWTASGGDITSITYAVLKESANGHAIAWSKLTTSGTITISNGNSMTIQFASEGIFYLV